MRSFKHRVAVVFLLMLGNALSSAAAAEYRQVAGLIDLRTHFSDGDSSPEALAHLARERGFEVLVFNDHDRVAVEYGLFPFRHLVKKKFERNSINRQGAEKYLAAIQRAREKYPDMILIPGSETTPFYFWQGSFFSGDLTVHDHEKRLLTIGMERPQDYRDLPILQNGFSTRFVKHYLPAFIAFFIAFLLSLLLLREKGPFRVVGILVSVTALLLTVNAHPFKSSPFDAYHGRKGMAPYQLAIDYVNARGGMTFWNYPETRSGRRKIGPVHFNTLPFPEVLFQAQDHTGFAALYGDRITATEPGRHWDLTLRAYCRGQRRRPVWGIATADYHKEGGAGQVLGDFPTVFLVPHKTRHHVLKAMKAGRMYACLATYPQRIILEEFSITSVEQGRKATLGEEITLQASPRITVFLTLKKPSDRPVKVRLMRGGRVIQVFSGPLPMKIEYEDRDLEPGGKTYYRLDVHGNGILVSNPIFVTVKN